MNRRLMWSVGAGGVLLVGGIGLAMVMAEGFISIRACSRNVCGDGSSLVVVCKLAPDLHCLRSRGCNRVDWRELSFFERCSWRNLCRHNHRLLNDENRAVKNGSVRVEA